MVHKKYMYKDKWGEIWKKLDENYVVRVSDGNVGCWFQGDGLEPIND